MSSEDAAAVTTEQPPASTEGQVSLEAFNAMKAQLENRNQELADARAQGKVFEERERQRVGGWQADVKDLMSEFMGREDPELKADISPLEPWVAEYATKDNIIAQRPLARVMAEASKTIKRVREEASVNKEAAATLSNTMKELDGVKGERDNLRQRLDEMSKLADERQDGMLKLQEELTRAGLLSDKHDFSKILNREKPAADVAAAITNGKAPEAAPTGGVTAEIAQASRGAASSSSVNPMEDQLLAMCMRGGGGSRIMPSGTSHAIFGGSTTDGVLAAIRAQ
jgi:hypothetical protein